MPRPSIYMNFSSNIAKVESRISNLFECFAEAKAYICPSGQIYENPRPAGGIAGLLRNINGILHPERTK